MKKSSQQHLIFFTVLGGLIGFLTLLLLVYGINLPMRLNLLFLVDIPLFFEMVSLILSTVFAGIGTYLLASKIKHNKELAVTSAKYAAFATVLITGIALFFALFLIFKDLAKTGL